MEYVSVASIGKPFGIKGQMHAFSLTSFPDLRFKKGKKYFLKSEKGDIKELTLSSVSIKGDALVLGFKEITTPEDAKILQGYTVNLNKEDAPMPEGYVRYDELVGMKGIDDDGNPIGTLLGVLENATTPSLRFKGNDGKVFYVPFIDVFVGEISMENKTIQIHVVEGML
ncbi:MAG: ribosome maturation factor RimM [Bacilli bacterium]|nr:ribosome maturation factor RimM [Bacilli bacterium]